MNMQVEEKPCPRKVQTNYCCGVEEKSKTVSTNNSIVFVKKTNLLEGDKSNSDGYSIYPPKLNYNKIKTKTNSNTFLIPP